MREIYNDNNLKVYADSDEYEVELEGGEFRLTKSNNKDILGGDETDINNLTVIIQGDKLMLEGNAHEVYINNLGFDITLKGQINADVENRTNSLSKPQHTHNLYGKSTLSANHSISPQHHTYLIHDNSQLFLDGTTQGTCDIIAYDNAEVITDTYSSFFDITLYNNSTAYIGGVDSTVWAYDNSKVIGGDIESVHLFDNATHSHYTPRF